MDNRGKGQPIRVQGDGRAQVKERVDETIEYGYGKVEITVRDHEIISIDMTLKTVRAPLQGRARA